MKTALYLACLAGLSLQAATYYVDSGSGKDSNPGTSEKAPWQSLARVNKAKLQPGDRVLFKRGAQWTGQLLFTSSGGPGAPIAVDAYGSGPKPHIDGAGQVEDVVRLYNLQQFELRNLELTNRGPSPAIRRGVHIFLENFGTAQHILVADLYIHDINGLDRRKDNGGIVFLTQGDRKPSRFEDLAIERNIVWKVDRSAIVAQSYHAPRARWYPSLGVVIRDNLVEDIGGDGIVPWATDGVLVEHNIARKCNNRSVNYNAGIWPWSTDNSLFQLNEAFETVGTRDGQGFDSDYNSRNTMFQYNYSHDNEGGFMLICGPGKRNPAENIGNSGTVVRYNVSRNDRNRLFNVSGDVTRTQVYGNRFYIGPDLKSDLMISQWTGWPDDAAFRDNLFHVEGELRYGHEVSRVESTGLYKMEPGWGPARRIVFEGNRYAGRNIDRPEDPRAQVEETAQPVSGQWDAPRFDPSRADGFEAFLARHRQWMMEFLERRLGRPVTLGR